MATSYSDLTPAQRVLFDLSSVREGCVQLPSDRQFMRLMPGSAGANTLQMLEPGDYTLVGSVLARWHKRQPSRVREEHAVEAPRTPKFVPKAPQSAVEVRIREMKGPQAVACVVRNRLVWPGPHPSNPGLTGMRAKNALYAAARRGMLKL